MIRILEGHVLEKLNELPAGSVHMCVTSPPYFGLRDYKLEAQVWDGDETCQHVWGIESFKTSSGGLNSTTIGDGDGQRSSKGSLFTASQGASCQHCSAWRGSLGLEPTPELYVSHLVQVFHAVKRVLRDDGTLWLNLGDSYAGSWGNQGRQPERGTQRPIHGPMMQAVHDGRYPSDGHNTGKVPPGLKPKDLVGMPWRVAFALQAAGWWLRSAITLCKLNPMPESVADRPTQATEMMFLLTKHASYFYDSDAVRQPHARLWNESNGGSMANPPLPPESAKQKSSGFNHRGSYPLPNPAGRNLRNWWPVTSEPFSGAHFAVFGTKWITPCILAGTSAKGACASCGAPWARVVERKSFGTVDYHGKYAVTDPQSNGRRMLANVHARRLSGESHDNPFPSPKTLGWRPSCRCGTTETKPCIVVDIFSGSGTTLLVADRLGRDGIGIELNPDYVAMARRRLSSDAPLFYEEG